LLLRYFSAPTAYPPWYGWLLAATVVTLIIIYTSSDHPFTFAVQHIGMQMRVSLCTLLYRKTLRMSKLSVEEITAGQIVNFLSSDMNRFDVLLTFLHYIWVAPIQLALVIAVMYAYLGIGWPCLAGISLIIVFVPFQGEFFRVFIQRRNVTSSG
jgi:ATP-binding cassette subfamily C (CFTR/MRP) protein 4